MREALAFHSKFLRKGRNREFSLKTESKSVVFFAENKSAKCLILFCFSEPIILQSVAECLLIKLSDVV